MPAAPSGRPALRDASGAGVSGAGASGGPGRGASGQRLSDECASGVGVETGRAGQTGGDTGGGAGVPVAGTGGGTVRPIVQHPDPRLRMVCTPAAGLAPPQRRTLVADLFATLYAAGGRGLAAPQIGVTSRVFVMDAGWKAGAPAPLAALDPRIVWGSARMVTAEEQCLSIPGRPVAVPRHAAIRLACLDPDGAPVELTLDGAAARIAQHELDHLDGVLILDAEDGQGA